VRVHDFLVEDLGRVVPYGVYDLAANTGWVSVGMYYDTSGFAVQISRVGQTCCRARRRGAARLPRPGGRPTTKMPHDYMRRALPSRASPPILAPNARRKRPAGTACSLPG